MPLPATPARRYCSPSPAKTLDRHVDQAVTHALASYPNVWVQARAHFDKTQITQVNQLLGLVYALLTVAIIIARIGVVNTLMLSVFERTRETGLLRGVGMKRRQVRAMMALRGREYSPRPRRSSGSPWKPI